MSLRAFGSLLGRRLWARGGILHARVQAQAETLGMALRRPLRSLNTLRDLDVVDIGALATPGGISALIGFLYSCYRDESLPVALEVTGKESTDVTEMKKPPVDDPAIRAKFIGEDGKVAWGNYFDYISFQMLHPEVTKHDEMIQRRYPRGPTIKPENVRAEEQECMSVDESAMKVRFEEWMKQFGRTYKNEEEKAMRYEIFKACAIRCDKINASRRSESSARYAPKNHADRTDEEKFGPRHQRDDSYWEEYFNRISRMYAEGRIEGYPRTVDADQKVGTDTAKQRYKVLKARKAGLDAAREGEQAADTRKTKGGC